MSAPLHARAYLAVAAGAACGGLVRVIIGLVCPSTCLASWPWPTLIANLAGSTLIGCFWALTTHRHVRLEIRLAAATGFCGSLTTFSGLAAETVTLAGDGKTAIAALYLSVSVIGSVLCATAGWWLGRGRV